MSIEKVAVIGSGVMGAGIAAQCANAGLSVVLLDIVITGTDDRCSLTKDAVQKQLKSGGFMSPEFAERINIGNLEDDFDKLSDADWIIEVVVEDLTIKRELYARIDPVRKPGAVVSSNTSTLRLQQLSEGMSEDFRRHFMITHFFNPPRHMRLLELVSSPETDTKALEQVLECCDKTLGKGVVHCKDTPGFIANRIGVYWLMTAVHEALSLGISVEEADALIGRPAGIPKTGIFGLWDLIGIDLWPKLAEGLTSALPANDPIHQVAAMPAQVERMIAEGYTGRKGKGGFYLMLKKEGKRIMQSLDLGNGEYRSTEKPALESLSAARNGLRAMLEHDDRGGKYAWRVLSQTLAYAASLIPEIADDFQSVDEAMRSGYAWGQGPFQLIDSIGPAWFAQRLEQEGRPVPEFLRKVGDNSFYRETNGELQVMNTDGGYHTIRRAPGVLLLEDIKRQSKALCSNETASLWDIGDGVTCLEFHTKMNAMQPESMELIQQALEITGRDHSAMVIYNEGTAFSAGANLALFAQWIKDGEQEKIRDLIIKGQQTYNALKGSDFPVVAAMAGMALGGGCEVALHCNAIQAHAETYAGLVEKNVGLIPAWGGCKEMLLRHKGEAQKVFQLIASARISSSAADARTMGILRDSDGISMNRERLLADAKAKVLELVNGYQPPAPVTLEINATQDSLLAWAEEQAAQGKFSPHDLFICKELSEVLATGNVTETELSSRELKAFEKVATTAESLARIEHMLSHGKPLRN